MGGECMGQSVIIGQWSPKIVEISVPVKDDLLNKPRDIDVIVGAIIIDLKT